MYVMGCARFAWYCGKMYNRQRFFLRRVVRRSLNSHKSKVLYEKNALNVHLQVVFDRLRFPLPSGFLCTADFVTEFSSILST